MSNNNKKNDEMDTLNLHSNFDNLLYIGRSVLNNTSSHIQKLFFKKEMCIYEYLYKEEVSKGIEIKIDDVVLVCALEHDKCNKSILYFNDVANIARYIPVTVILNIKKNSMGGSCQIVILLYLYLRMIMRSDLRLYKLYYELN